jgi:uncharacterized damage-inducible protein DinB
MKKATHADRVAEWKKFFDKSTGVFTEKDSKFAPKPGMMTVSQHVAHVAQAIDWFIEGAFRKEGYSMEFEKMAKEIAKVSSLKKARAWLDKSIENAVKVLKSKTPADMNKPISGALMTNEPRSEMLIAFNDHISHHRGALTVYARLLGRVSPMPYM